MRTRASLSSTDSAPRKTRQPRTLSASEIARNTKYFETWCDYQGCEQVAFSDIPDALSKDVESIFMTDGVLPAEWLDKSSKVYKRTKKTDPDFLKFLNQAFKESPEMFSKDVSASSEKSHALFSSLKIVFVSWNALNRLKSAVRKVSEAEFVANVYEGFRSAALTQNEYRAKSAISLPQPMRHLRFSPSDLRLLSAKTVIPDGSIFLSEPSIRHLSAGQKSPFKSLKRHSLTNPNSDTYRHHHSHRRDSHTNIHTDTHTRTHTHTRTDTRTDTAVRTTATSSVSSTSSTTTITPAPTTEASFAIQCTPCAQLQSSPCFEFASCFWEDKKPVHRMLEDAYRQNRMATASGLRMLSSMGVNAPVVGLIWSSGTVRAHVDWWCLSEKSNRSPIIRSAPYPGPPSSSDISTDDDTDAESESEHSSTPSSNTRSKSKARSLSNSLSNPKPKQRTKPKSKLSPSPDPSHSIFHEWSLSSPSDMIQVFLIIRNIDNWTSTRFLDHVTSGVQNFTKSIVEDRSVKFKPWKRVGKLVPSGTATNATTAKTITRSSKSTKAVLREVYVESRGAESNLGTSEAGGGSVTAAAEPSKASRQTTVAVPAPVAEGSTKKKAVASGTTRTRTKTKAAVENEVKDPKDKGKPMPIRTNSELSDASKRSRHRRPRLPS